MTENFELPHLILRIIDPSGNATKSEQLETGPLNSPRNRFTTRVNFLKTSGEDLRPSHLQRQLIRKNLIGEI